MKRGKRCQRGLTLLETLVALSIFATIGVASYQVLNTTLLSNRALSAHIDQLAELQSAVRLIDSDFQQIVDRPIRVENEEYLESPRLLEGGRRIELTRGGQNNPLQLSLSNLVRVGYDVGQSPDRDKPDSFYYDDETYYLRRHIWPTLDRIEKDDDAHIQLLLPAEDALFTVITEDGSYNEWPINNTQAEDEPPPNIVALLVEIEHPELGQVQRLVKVY